MEQQEQVRNKGGRPRSPKAGRWAFGSRLREADAPAAKRCAAMSGLSVCGLARSAMLFVSYSGVRWDARGRPVDRLGRPLVVRFELADE